MTVATLKIWNVEDEIVLEDTSKTMESLEDLLEAYKEENKLWSSGGLGYDVKIHTNDDVLMLKDELEDDYGRIVGRYEMKVY